MCGCNERLAKSSGNCKALHQSQRRLIRSIVRNPPGGARPVSVLVNFPGRPARLHLRSSFRYPLSLQAHTRAPHPRRGLATPSPTLRRRRAAFGPRWLPSPRPLPGSRSQPDPPRLPFPRQPRRRPAAAGARGRARARREARAQARARASRRSEAARAPPSAVGGGAQGAAEPRGGGRGGGQGSPGSASCGRRSCRAKRIPSPGSRYVSSKSAVAGTSPPRCPGPVAGLEVGATRGLQDACPEGLGSHH